MKRRFLSVAAAAAVVLMLSMSTSQTQASGSPRPLAEMITLTPSISVGQQPEFKYATYYQPAHATVILQRRFGASGIWRTVAGGLTGKRYLKAPTLPIGVYTYRLQTVLNRRAVSTSTARTVYSFGAVALSSLCSDDCDSNAGTVQVGPSIFSYSFAAEPNAYPSYETALATTNTSCRSITVNFALQDSNGETSSNAYLEVVQSATDPQYASTPAGTIGTMTASLDGGPFYLETATDDPDDVGDLYLNGTALCYTPDGTP